MNRRVMSMTAGPYTEVTVYPVLSGSEGPHERAVIKKCSSEAMQRMNDRRALRRFKFLMACNFSPQDYVVELTYKDEFLPATPDEARKKYLRPFFARMRKDYKKRGYPPLKYMYVTEGLHGDHRIHHHIILQRVPSLFDMVEKNWCKNGFVKLQKIGSDAYAEWAGYLTKEPRDKSRHRVGQRMWTPSMNLQKPIVDIYDVESDFIYVPPAGANVVRNTTDRLEMGWYQYVSFVMPQTGQTQEN